MILRVPGTANSVLTLERSFADQWPFDPRYKDAVKHPSQSFYYDCDYLHIHDLRSRTIRLVLLKLRGEAEETLKDCDVRHLEVQVISVEAHHAERKPKCPACDWLYYTEYSDGYLVGWYAVIRGDGHDDSRCGFVSVPGPGGGADGPVQPDAGVRPGPG